MKKGDKLFEVTREGRIREAKVLNVYESSLKPDDPFMDFTFSKKAKPASTQVHTYHVSQAKALGLFKTKLEACEMLIGKAEENVQSAIKSQEKWTEILSTTKAHKEKLVKKENEK